MSNPKSFFRKHVRQVAVLILAVAVVPVAITSCSKEKIDELTQSAKDQFDKTKEKVTESVEKATETASAKAGLSGSMTLTADKTASTEACYATFVAQQPERSNVLKLQSYILPETESFPSALIQAQVDGMTQEQLSGKSVKAQVFLQQDPGGPVWSTKPDEPAQITIGSLRDKMLTAQIVTGTVYNSETGDSVQLKGQVEGVFH